MDFMTAYTYVLIGLLGLVMGSFFNVCIYRIPQGKSVVRPASACGTCGHRLGVLDMIPVFTWLFTRGRCRHCGARYSGRYALVESLTCLLYLAVYAVCGVTWQCLAGLVLVSLLVIIAFIDLDESIIPNGLVLIGLICGLAYQLVRAPWWDGLLGAAAGALPLLAVDGLGRLVYKKEGMGLGDVKMMAFAGLFLGWQATLLALLLAVVLGGAVGGVGLATGRLKRGAYMPFGPFLAMGTVAAFLFGPSVIRWYLSLLI